MFITKFPIEKCQSGKYLGWSPSASPADQQGRRGGRHGGRLPPVRLGGAPVPPGVGGGRARAPPGTETSENILDLLKIFYSE